MKFLTLLFISFLLPLLTFAQGTITTIAGDGGTGYGGDGGQATAAKLEAPRRAVMDSAGNIYFVHQTGNRVRKISTSGIITTVAGTGTAGFSGDGGPATAAELNVPSDVAVDSIGNLYIADLQNYRIRKVDAATGIISTIAGNGQNGITGNGGPATAASIFIPYALTLDHLGNLYIAGNAYVRKIDPSGIITGVCGLGGNMWTGDGGLAINADINVALSLCVDSDDNLYILGGARVRKIDRVTGIISTIAGNGNYAFGGDGGPATAATIAAEDIKMDRHDNIYLADGNNSRIRRITTQGIIGTVVGTGSVGFTGDGGDPLLCKLNRPAGIAIDTCGNLVVTDYNTNRIRKVAYPGCALSVKNNTEQSVPVVVYPNPTTGQLTITGSNLKEIVLINTLGQTALQQKATGERTTIDITHLTPGIYFITITDKTGRKETQKIVKE